MERIIEPLVSVVVITYNHEKYIKQCLDGVLMQQASFPFEILINDDASTDHTALIVKEYASKYPNIIKPIYQEKNQYSQGIHPWFDILFPRAQGKYIAICEGDDYWTDPLKLQKQIDFLERNEDYAGCTHQSIVIYDDNRPSHIFRKNVNSDINLYDIIEGRVFHTASLVFRRKVILNIKDFPKVTSGDRLLNFLIILSGKIFFFDDSMCIYRKHDSGMSSMVTVDMMKLDLKMVPFLKGINKHFPKYRYLSFVCKTIATYPKNVGILQKIHYLGLFFIYSFSIFPKNIIIYMKQFAHYSYKITRNLFQRLK